MVFKYACFLQQMGVFSRPSFLNYTAASCCLLHNCLLKINLHIYCLALKWQSEIYTYTLFSCFTMRWVNACLCNV